MHRTLRRAALWAAAIAALVMALPPSSHGEEEWPGLPESDGLFGHTWNGAAQGGISYAARAKQWVRSPDGMVTFQAKIKDLGTTGDCARATCIRRFGGGGRAYIVSPEGAPAPYGYMAPMTVRSVGFGLMPVEATVQVSQRRQGGYPVPFESWIIGTDHFDSSVQREPVSVTQEPVTVDAAVEVRILKVLVDGVDLGLTGDCRAATPAPITMKSAEFTIDRTDSRYRFSTTEWFRSADPASFFDPEFGGQLSGTITIPPFTGCTTASGDDLSDLMTLSVSGPDNPVTARIGWPCGGLDDDLGVLLGRPLRQGENTPKRTLETAATVNGPAMTPGCHGTKKLPYPERPAG